MSEIIGDTAHLHRRRVRFSAVHTYRGNNGAGNFTLTNAKGFKQYLTGRASVRLVSDSLQVRVIGPASPSKAVVAHLAVVPSELGDWPTAPGDILTIGGSAFAQHSLYVPVSSVPLGLATEVAHVLRPEPVVGRAPVVVFHITVTGGTATDETFINITGELEVDGIGFVQTW